MNDMGVEADAKHLHEQPGPIGTMRLAGPQRAGSAECQRGRNGFG